MKDINNKNCIKLYEVMEDKMEEDDPDYDNASEKIYMILELAKYKEIMVWNENTYRFIPNKILL